MGLRRLIQDASNARILVVGDMALDCYRVMRAKRLSSEAPVVIFSQERAETRPGCAANVANNLHALGCKVKLISCVGTDWHSYEDEVDFQFPVDWRARLFTTLRQAILSWPRRLRPFCLRRFGARAPTSASRRAFWKLQQIQASMRIC